jgi:hypothetical protein
VQVGGVADASTYVSSTQITATVTASQLASGGQLSVIALNGTAGSGSGAAVSLQVTNPAPTITALTPAVLAAGTASPNIAVSGTGFVPTTVIDVNGSARTTTFVSATQVNVTLTSADVASAGSVSLTAVNGTPGGGTSAATTIPINNPAPGRVITLAPAAIVTGAATPTTITVTGTNFLPVSTVQVNGTSRATTFVNATQLTFQLTVTEQAVAQSFSVTVVNPTPGGGTSLAAQLQISQPIATPVITQVSPAQFLTGSSATTLYVYGTNLFPHNSSVLVSATTSVLWNGTALTLTAYGYSYNSDVLVAAVPASLLTSVGTASITVSDSLSIPATSNAITVTIANPPPPTLTSIYPSAGPIGTATPVNLYGTGFTASSTVALNGTSVPATYVSSTELTTTIPASSVALPGNLSFTVTTPAPGGGTTAPLPFTAYVGLVNNDLVYNAADGLLYASVPGSAGAGGNSVTSIDPVTGNIVRQIFVGSNPNKLALSSDGTQLFVGLDGAAAVAQLNLTTGKVVNQFSLGGGPGVYNPPYTATALAAVPGQPNSVAVAADGSYLGGSGVTFYDSGVARAKTSSSLGFGNGPLCFGSSASTLYMASGSTVYKMTVDSTGITGGSTFYSGTNYYYQSANIQYDSGRLYLSSGVVVDGSTAALLGTFYATTSTAASGPIISDSTLGLAFVGYSGSVSGTPQVLAFNESSFNPTGSIAVSGVSNSGYPSGFQKILRWGQNGVALNTSTQIFIFQSPVVKDLSPSPADLSVTLSAPATANTGSAISYVATVKNLGPNQALDAALALTLDSSLIVNSITPSQGSCTSGSALACDLGNLANGASATVTLSATPSSSGTIAGSASVTSASYDPAAANNQATTSTTVSGNLYGAVPSLSSISPALVQAGSGAFTLTVTGSGFNTNSVVNLGGAALTTSFVSATQLTAEVNSPAIANYGWAPVTVSNPAPGGGLSPVVPLTIYALVNVPANSMVFDPYSRNLYASVPSAATTLTGNSIVAINPFTAVVGTPVAIGSEPNVMAETSDGNYLWVGLSGADSLAQFNLLNQTVSATIPITTTQYGTTASAPATWLAAMPGSDTTLAMDINDTWGNFGIFDVSGNTGTFRKNFSGIYSGVNPSFASATELYAYDSQTSGAEFYRYTVDANGLTLIDGTTLDGMGGFSGGFKLANGIVYGGAGGIANPSTTPPSQIATLPPIDFYQSGITDSGVAVVPDPSTQKDFLMLENAAGTWEYALARYSTTQYLPEAWLPMPASTNNVLTGWQMLRFGQDGLALLAGANTQINSQAVSQILLLRGPFVTPQLLTTNSAASLTASSATAISHGTGNTLLTLTGTNLAPGVAVTWNGSYRTTTIVDASHLTVAIPASDLANAGSGSLVATNPGAPASNTLTVTVN